MFEYERKKEEVMKSNHTNIPSQLREKVEQSTGYDLGDVNVHYNSRRPTVLDALAYTQGNQIYLGPGQEHHLPHELGHVVQQKMGIVHADTKHRSGAWMNTNEALEQQADRIGAGESVIGFSKIGYQSEQPVQRMTVYEGMETVSVGADEAGKMGIDAEENSDVNVEVPKLARYKRKGWKFIQGLNRYFNKSSTENATVTQMGNVYVNLDRLVNMNEEIQEEPFVRELEEAKGEFEYTESFQKELKERQKGFQHLKEETKEMKEILEAGMELTHPGMADEEQEIKWRNDPIKSLEKRGEYVRISDVDPYFNYKKIAMHCIAHMATKIVPKPVFLGPHVAITVVGKTIFVASNTVYTLRKNESQADMETLKGAVRAALDNINEANVEHIMHQEKDYAVAGAKFEDINSEFQPEFNPKEVLEWIKKIRSYPIAIVDVTKARDDGEVIHGEMTIMDYLLSSKENAGGVLPDDPISPAQIMERRTTKLKNIQGEGEEMRRVIQFGGTRMDCKKCHEHFNHYRTLIEQNYIVSSKHTASFYFYGTEAGTNPESKGMKGKAKVVEFELEQAFITVKNELSDLKNSLNEILKSRKKLGIVQGLDEIDIPEEMVQLVDVWNAALPDLKEKAVNYASQIVELEKLIYEVTSLYLFGAIKE